MSDPLWLHGLYSSWNSPGQNTGVGKLFLLQGSSQLRNQTQVSHIAGRFFTRRTTREAQLGEDVLYVKSESESQSCPTLCDLMDCNLSGSSVHGILQARILEWVAYPFSKESSQPRNWTQVSCIAGRFFTSWATREALLHMWSNLIFTAAL